VEFANLQYSEELTDEASYHLGELGTQYCKQKELSAIVVVVKVDK